MSKEHPHLGGFMLLPPKPGTCQECATEHDAAQPHNQQSLFYQYSFYGRTGRWPTWCDSMAHCTEDVKAIWTRELTAMGVAISPLPAETKRTKETKGNAR